MRRGFMMCGCFVTSKLPTIMLLCIIGCCLIGGSCLGVGVNSDCWYISHDYICLKDRDALTIAGSVFLGLAGLLLIPTIVFYSILCCCPSTRPVPNMQNAFVFGSPSGYPGPLAFGGDLAATYPTVGNVPNPHYHGQQAPQHPVIHSYGNRRPSQVQQNGQQPSNLY